MSNICNSLNFKTVKISQLGYYSDIQPNDLFLVIKSGSYLQSKRTTVEDLIQTIGRYPNFNFSGSIKGVNNILNFKGTGINVAFNGTGSYSVSSSYSVRADYAKNAGSISSDVRLKTNIKPIENSFDLINKLNPVKFEWISTEQSDFGFIAQEVEKELPTLVNNGVDGYKTVKYASFIPILLKSIQDLQQQVDELKKQIMEFKNKL